MVLLCPDRDALLLDTFRYPLNGHVPARWYVNSRNRPSALKNDDSKLKMDSDMNECVLNLSQDNGGSKSEFKIGEAWNSLKTKSPSATRRTPLKRKRIEKIEPESDSNDGSSGPTVFEPDLHCSICVNMFKEPHVTRCGHTFCRQGIRSV